MYLLPKVSVYTNPSGENVFRVVGRAPSGKEFRRNFATEAKAHQFLADIEGATPSQGTTGAATTQMNLTELDRDSLLAILQKVVAPAVTPAPALAPSLTVDTALTDFLSAKRTKRLRPRTVSDYESRLSALRKKYSAASVATLRREDLEPLVHRPGLAALTVNGNRRALFTFFEWCRRVKKAVPVNPVEDIDTAQVEDTEPVIFTLAEVRALLTAAQECKRGVLLPYFVIGFFAGLRPAEAARLQWGTHISLDKKVIFVSADIAKKRKRRVIELSENLIAWLKLKECKGKPIVGKNWRRNMDIVRRRAGFKGSYPTRKDRGLRKWPGDAIRHTALSYHFAMHNDERKTSYWAGNSPDTMHKFYKGLVTMEEAKVYWALLPPNLI